MHTPFSVFVIRPYHSKIRNIIFGAIKSAGGVFREDWIVPAGEPDTAVIASLRQTLPDVLLCPFNPHQNTLGKEVHGFTVLDALYQEGGLGADTPILMPVTQLGKPRCMSMLKRSPIQNKDNILVIDQAVYESNELTAYIQAHLDKFG